MGALSVEKGVTSCVRGIVKFRMGTSYSKVLDVIELKKLGKTSGRSILVTLVNSILVYLATFCSKQSASQQVLH